jgi:hypothetical protein
MNQPEFIRKALNNASMHYQSTSLCLENSELIRVFQLDAQFFRQGKYHVFRYAL